MSQAKRILIVWSSTLLFCGLSMGAAADPAPASGDAIMVIPADSLFCARISKLNTTLGQIDQFLTGVSPVGVSLVVPAQLAKLLGTAQPKGINMSGDFAAFGPLPGGEGPNPGRMARLIPVTNYAAFTEENPNVGPPNAQGVSTIRTPVRPDRGSRVRTKRAPTSIPSSPSRSAITQ